MKKLKELDKIARELAARITPETPGAWCEGEIDVCEEVSRSSGVELTIEEASVVLERLDKLRGKE